MQDAGNTRKKIIVSAIYALMLVICCGLAFLGFKKLGQVPKSFQKPSVIMEQESREGFKVTLPSGNWRFLSPVDAIKIMGGSVTDTSISIADISGEIFGIFLGEDLAGVEVNKGLMTELASMMKEAYMPGHTLIKKTIEEDNFVFESEFVSGGIEYAALYAYFAFEHTGVSCFLWGERAVFGNLREEILQLIYNIQQTGK